MNLRNLPRLFPSALPLNSVGYQFTDYRSSGLQHKSIDFGLVLSSETDSYTYSVDEKERTYKPPLFFVKGPGNAYGNQTAGLREVFYFTYSGNAIHQFENMKLEPGSPGIEICHDSPIIKLALEAVNLSNKIHELGTVDKIENLCETILIEASIIKRQRSGISTINNEKINEIISFINNNFREKTKLSDLIKKYGFSKRSFYREWNKKYSISPVDYIESLKMSEASNLLSNTKMQISEIATELKYDDPMYFSRRFTKHFNTSPREYRKQFKI
jgi:AraC-like DNA-binding protein